MIGSVRREGIVVAALGFTAVHAVLAVLDAPALPPAGVLAYYGALVLAVAAVLVTPLPWPDSPARHRAVGWAVVGGTIAVVLLVVAVLPADAGGFALWYVSLVPVPLAGVALRGLPLAALTGATVNAGATLVWSGLTGMDVVIVGVYRVVSPTAAVVVAVVIAGVVEQTRRSVADAHAEREEAARVSAVTRASDAERQRRIAEVERLTGPVLRRLAAGEPVGDRLAAECRLLEASLRDDIRAPSLATVAVREATWPARARGVEVRLLDLARPRGPEAVAQPVAVEVRRCLVRVLEELEAGVVTARLARDGRGTLVVVGPGAADLARLCAHGEDAAEERPRGGVTAGVVREVEVTDEGELLVTFRSVGR